MRRLGFTLIEMLVALAVFAVIGLMSNQLLTQIIDLGQLTEARGERLVEVQRAIEIVRRDIQQLVHRSVRDELGDSLPGFEIDQFGSLQLTRRGWANPLGHRRSELQRVAYAWVDGALFRLYWPVLDRARDSLPIRQLLLNDVTEWEVLAFDAAGVEHRFWPPESPGEDAPDAGDNALVGVIVRLTLPPYGNIERLWSVPSSSAVPIFPDTGETVLNTSSI